MIPDKAWNLIPEEFPPELPAWIENVARSAEFSSREYRAYAWAMHLLSNVSREWPFYPYPLRQLLSFPTPGWVVDISAGFIPFRQHSEVAPWSSRTRKLWHSDRTIDIEGAHYSFGVVIGVSMDDDHEEASFFSDRSILRPYDISGFPVILEPRKIIRNAPPHPIGATSACYARPRRSKRFFGPIWSDGIVIARHVLSAVGYSTGTAVPMYSGASASVVDIDFFASTIDAAILDCGSIPQTAAFLPLPPALAPGSVVEVRSPTQPFRAQVLRINDHPSYFGNMTAHRVFVDTIGINGDSGSLVQGNISGFGQRTAAGLYMGSTGGTLPEGLVQSMRQVVEYFDIDLYD